MVIAPGSSLAGETLASTNFRQRYDATVLALRRGGEVIRQRMDHLRLRVGDTLLVQATGDSVDRLNTNPNFIVAGEVERPDFRRSKSRWPSGSSRGSSAWPRSISSPSSSRRSRARC